MDPQLFRNLIADVHENWLANILGFDKQTEGIDLVRGNHGIEVKARLVTNCSMHITIHDYQYHDFKKRHTNLYWAFMFYRLAKPVRTVTTTSQKKLETLVTERRTVIAPWDFAKTCTYSDARTGPYRYVQADKLVTTSRMIRTLKGPIYLPENYPFPAEQPKLKH